MAKSSLFRLTCVQGYWLVTRSVDLTRCAKEVKRSKHPLWCETGDDEAGQEGESWKGLKNHSEGSDAGKRYEDRIKKNLLAVDLCEIFPPSSLRAQALGSTDT